jgi:hypothetical protein
VPAKNDVYAGRDSGWRSAGSRARLIDTRVVRAELVRLRALRPGTEVCAARVVRSTVSRQG